MLAALFLVVGDPMSGDQHAVVDCVTANAVELAGKSDAPAAELVAAANAACFGTWEQSRMIQRGLEVASRYSPTYRADVATGKISAPTLNVNSPEFKQLVDGTAIKAVLEARAPKKP